MRLKEAEQIIVALREQTQLLEELYNLAKRLDERMGVVERLVATDDPAFTPVKRLMADHQSDNEQLRELEQLIAEKKGAAR